MLIIFFQNFIHFRTSFFCPFYCLFEFKGEPTIVKKLETAYRRDERVLRFLTFRLDKYAVEYAEKRRKVRAGKANEEQKVVTVETKED